MWERLVKWEECGDYVERHGNCNVSIGEMRS